ncbi:MAG: hypothetical protein Kow00117_13910 [Phototrophicales bacterium]
MQQQNKTLQRLTYAFGIFMALVLFLPTLLQGIAPRQTVQQQAENTPVPTAVPLPDPLTDFSGITFDEQYLHPSGLFTVDLPNGWTSTTTVNNRTQAQVTLNNGDLLSVVEVYIQQPAEPITSVEDLSAYFTSAVLASSWSRYRNPRELPRTLEEDRVIIDFVMEQNGVNYRAKHVATFDDQYIYVTRIVVPENQEALLFWLADEMPKHVHLLEQFADAPMGWIATFDQDTSFVFRHPNTWSQLTGGRGQIYSFTTPENAGVQISVTPDASIASEDEAIAYVSARHADAEILSVQAVERVGATGFAVAYGFTDFDGAPQSGYAVLLNGETGHLYTAIAEIPQGGVDLNDVEARGSFVDLGSAMDSFGLLLGLNLPELPPLPTPTPRPSATPVVESTPEATPEAEMTEDAQASSAAEATEESAATAESGE